MKKKPFDLVHASPSLISETEREIATLERMLEKDRASGRNKIQDVQSFQAEINQKKTILTKYAPKKLKGPAQNKAYDKAKKLADRIKKKLPNNQMKQLMYPGPQSDHKTNRDFEDAVAAEMAVLKDQQLQSDIREYKYIMRQIDPSDPTITNIERFREGRHVRIRR